MIHPRVGQPTTWPARTSEMPQELTAVTAAKLNRHQTGPRGENLGRATASAASLPVMKAAALLSESSSAWANVLSGSSPTSFRLGTLASWAHQPVPFRGGLHAIAVGDEQRERPAGVGQRYGYQPPRVFVPKPERIERR